MKVKVSEWNKLTPEERFWTLEYFALNQWRKRNKKGRR